MIKFQKLKEFCHYLWKKKFDNKKTFKNTSIILSSNSNTLNMNKLLRLLRVSLIFKLNCSSLYGWVAQDCPNTGTYYSTDWLKKYFWKSGSKWFGSL